MRSLLLTVLAGATVLAGLLVTPAGVARAADGYSSRVVAEVQAARAARGLDSMRTRGAAAHCLDRHAQRWAEAGSSVALDALARTCEVDRVRRVHYTSDSAPTDQVGRLLARSKTRRPLLAGPSEMSLGLGHAKVRGEHRVVMLVGTLPPGPSVDPQLTRQEVVALTNAERAAVGRHALVADTCLMGNAQRHAERLARTGRLVHQDLGRVADDCGGHSSYGENVLWNASGTAREAMQMWLGSSDHAANLHEASYRTTGVGVGYDRYLRRYYVVQVFAGR
jgi:uncharacterized protein YkwD